MQQTEIREIETLSSFRFFQEYRAQINKLDIENCAKYIRQYGPAPLVISPVGEILDGHCRYEAFKLLGVCEIEVTVMDATEEDQSCHSGSKLTAKQLADEIGLDPSLLPKYIKLLQLIDPLQQKVRIKQLGIKMGAKS